MKRGDFVREQPPTALRSLVFEQRGLIRILESRSKSGAADATAETVSIDYQLQPGLDAVLGKAH